MTFLGNILWLVLAGIWLAVGYAMAGLVAGVLIVTIPFAVQSFKLAGFALWPFGRMVVRRAGGDRAVSFLANTVWFLFAGIWLALMHLVAAVLLFITVIGIPFALANLKMAGLALSPFGKTVVDAREVWPAELVVVSPLELERRQP